MSSFPLTVCIQPLHFGCLLLGREDQDLRVGFSSPFVMSTPIHLHSFMEGERRSTCVQGVLVPNGTEMLLFASQAMADTEQSTEQNRKRGQNFRDVWRWRGIF